MGVTHATPIVLGQRELAGPVAITHRPERDVFVNFSED
jgi:hypothetical protein